MLDTVPGESFTSSKKSEYSNSPRFTISASSGPAFFPKLSIAILAASVLSEVRLIVRIMRSNSRLESLPWSDHSLNAVFMPASMVSAFTPAFSHLANSAIVSSVSYPIARICEPFLVRLSARRSTDIPLACPATASWSSSVPYSDASIPAFSIARETSLTACVASVPVTAENFRKSSEVFSSCSPV